MKNIYILKKTLYFILVAVWFGCITGCDKSENNNPYQFTTDSLLTFRLTKLLDEQSINGIAGKAYNPVGVRQSGDTLFIANRADGADGVWVVRASTGELLKDLTEWTYQGQKEVFDNQVIDVAVNSNYIFVVNRSSRIDMFRRSDYSYVTTIGKTGWQSSPLLQCEAAEAVGNKLFIRDKHRVKVVRLEDCTPENRFKVPIFAQSVDSTTQNNGFHVESLIEQNGLVYVSDYESYAIYVIDPQSVTVKDEPVRFIRSYRFAAKPLGMDFYKGRLYVVCADKSIVCVDPQTGKSLGRYTGFATGISWDDPARIYFVGNEFYLLSRYANKPWLKKGEMSFVEISHINQP